MSKASLFTPYQKFIIAILAALQFSIILDFMVLSPLGALLMPALSINPQQFGWVVSAYAFSAGISGLMAAGFADSYDRKKLLLFFAAGFIIGTILCAVAPNYWFLLMARIVTGLFGGVVGSVAFAIITDLFEPQVRGQVMGFVQMAFAVSQVLGLPIGLYFANLWGWHSPFVMVVAVAIPIWLLIFFRMKPVNAHLSVQRESSAFQHLVHTVSTPFYQRGFATAVLLATGGFMLMPFGSAFSVNNLGVKMEDLPQIYLVTGVCSMIFGPLIGKLTDRFGPMSVFTAGSILSIILVLTYTNLGVTPLWLLIVLNAILFVGITARMISSSSLMSNIPTPADRGAFMGINASISQISGGVATVIAGLIIHQEPNGMLKNYPLLGIVVAVSMIACVGLMSMIARAVARKKEAAKGVEPVMPSEVV